MGEITNKIKHQAMRFVNLSPNKFHSKFKLQNSLLMPQMGLLFGFRSSRGKVIEN